MWLRWEPLEYCRDSSFKLLAGTFLISYCILERDPVLLSVFKKLAIKVGPAKHPPGKAVPGRARTTGIRERRSPSPIGARQYRIYRVLYWTAAVLE